jgi:serine/threonine protein kinase
LTGFLPFSDKVPEALIKKIQDVDYNWTGCPPISSEGKHFVSCLLKRDPKQRLSMERALKHPWIVVNSNIFF